MTSNNEEQELRAQQLQPVVVGNAGPAILGIKFFDQNLDGIRQPNEPGLANIPILLEPAADSDGVLNRPTESTTTTDANGAFSFINRIAGNYLITETAIPAGLTSTTPNPLAVTLGNSNVNVFFGNGPIEQGSRIVGCKYLDIDADGFRDGNEPGIKNVRIYIDANGNGQRDLGELNTLTDKNGRWQFNVPAGTYKIREERIRREVSSATGVEVNDPNAEPLETQDFPQSTPPDNVPVLDVTVAAGETFACAQVGDTPLYQIVVNKFQDLDLNGQRNIVGTSLEPPVSLVPFILDENKDGKFNPGEKIQFTDENGNATFKDLRAGNYPVLEIFNSTLPRSLLSPAQLSLLATRADLAIAGNTTDFRPGNLNLPVATTGNPTLVSAPGPQARFQGTISREQPLLVADSTYTLRRQDPKFIDNNLDGVQQLPGEVSIPATGVRPIFANTPVPLPAPNPSPALTFSSVGINNTVGGNSPVGNTLPIINVFKYNDLNANGSYEPTMGEAPINGVTVFLDTNNNGTPESGEQQIQTNVEGRGVFRDLPAGNYTVREVVPAGFSPSTTPVVPVTLSTQNANVTFANTPNSNITGCKFEDLNQNGYRDGNEPFINGVIVYIDTNRDGVRQQNEPFQTTSGFGTFAFNNLAPGTYSVREELSAAQLNFVQTTQPLDIVLGPNQTFTCALIGNTRLYDLKVQKFKDDNQNGVLDPNEGPLQGIPFTLDLNKNGSYDPTTEPLVRTEADGIALFPDLLPDTYSVLEVFNAPGVPNPFPIATGPNPVSFSVPGPNTVPSPPRPPATPPKPPATKTDASIDLTGNDAGAVTASSVVESDPLNNPGLVAQSVTPTNNLIVLDDPGLAYVDNFAALKESAQASIVTFLDAQKKAFEESASVWGVSTSTASTPKLGV
ncbi:SdrD B-like domain-containing protein [Microcoleus sp. MOSTC5]|uniref:SdrD B-like domain-containing protein n=1 Tax=Microcoleus sp. MOSTC5 TaxID=3055378 RepID=UPI002FCECD98